MDETKTKMENSKCRRMGAGFNLMPEFNPN